MNRMLARLLQCLSVLLLTSTVHGAVVSTAPGTINTLQTYSEAGGGDVTFVTTTTFSGCDGFWLRPTDAGFKALYAALTMAYATQTPVMVFAHNDSIWTGSGSPFCRVYMIRQL